MAAQDAELKLKVSLDLAFFRQQLTGLGQAAAGYQIPINVKFDRQSLIKQQTLLSNALKRTVYDVKIESNSLEKLVAKVETFKKSLKNLEAADISIDVNINASVPKFGRDQTKKIRAQIRRDILSEGGQIPLDTKLNLPNVATFVKNLSKQAQIVVGLKNGATGKEVQNVLDAIQGRIEANQKIKQGGGKLRVPVSIKPGINNEDIAAFKATVQSKLGGITVKIKAEFEGGFAAGKTGLAGLQEYMRTQGMSGGNMPGGVEIGRRAQFESLIGSASHADLKRYMKIAEIPGRSALTTKAQMHEALLKANDIAMESILGNMKMQMRDPLPIKRGFLDQVARAVFWMAGVDPEYLKQQAAQRKALPAVNFPASVPVQNLSIGPSGTGRALPPGAIPSALPGTAFGGQKYLPTDLGEETKKVLRDAANAFLDAIRQGIREVKVQDMGNAVSRQPLLSGRLPAGLLPGRTVQTNVLDLNNILAGAIREYFKAVEKEVAGGPRAAISRQPLLGPGSQVAGLLPAAGGTTPRGQMRFNAVSGGAVLGQPQFMRAPSIPAPIGGGGGGMQPPSRGGGGGMGGFSGFGRALGGLNLPGTGAIKGLGSEFAFATKQVLLFGQAYKLLGFIQDFPGQVAQAVAELQSFRNTLLSVTGNAQNAADANEFILAVVEKYNVPLDAARNGFTKLYASMAPAGFGGGEIQNLFIGISKAAATFGLSADKVDRVNYAFAQMASKGQIMSEELKGQLGDVLPGAMAIFAKAAGFEGPDAITKFSKALEDGVYKGNEMHKLLRNVGIEMNKEFGPGAEGAAKTFQGAINRLQNAFKGLYESFEPAAIGVLNSVMLPVVGTLKALTDGVNAYFKGQQASTPAAQEFTNVLQTLVPTLSGISENLKTVFIQLGPLAKGLGAIILGIGQILALPLVGQLAATYAQVLILTTAFNALAASGIAVAALATARFIAQGIVYAQVTLGMRVATQQTTVAMMQFGTTMQTVMIRSVVGVALVAISALIGRIVELRGQLATVAGDAKAMENLAKSSAKLGDIGATKEAVGNIRNQLETYRALQSEIQKTQKAAFDAFEKDPFKRAPESMKLSKQWGDKALQIGLLQANQLKKTAAGYELNMGLIKQTTDLIDAQVNALSPAAAKGSTYIDQAIAQQKKLKEQMPGLAGAGIDEKTLKTQQKAAETLADQQQRDAIDAAKFQNNLNEISFQKALDLNDALWQAEKDRIDAKYDYEAAGANELQSRQFKFAKDLQDEQFRRIEAVRKFQESTAKASFETASAANVAAAAGAGPATGYIDKSVLRDWLIKQGFGRTTGDFTNAGHSTPNHMLNAMDMGILGGSDAEALLKTTDMERKLRATGAFGNQLFGPISDPYGHGAGKGGQNIHLHIPTPGGKVAVNPALANLMALGVGAAGPLSSKQFSMQSRATAESRDLEISQAKEQANLEIQRVQVQKEIGASIQRTAAIIRENLANIYPVQQQKLEIDLMKQRNQLQLQGMPQEVIDYMEKKYKAETEGALALNVLKDNLSASEAELANYQEQIKNGATVTPKLQAEIDALQQTIALYKKQITDAPTMQREYNTALLEGTIAAMKNADALKALQETSERINSAVEGVTGTYKDLFKEIAKGTNSVEALKKAQGALADQALTMFFDFAMKPVEDFFKKTLGGIFGVPDEEAKRKEMIAKLEQQLQEQKNIAAATQQTAVNTGQGATMPSGTSMGLPMATMPSGISMGLSVAGPTIGLTESLADPSVLYADQLGKVDTSIKDAAVSIGKTAEEMKPEGIIGSQWQKALGGVVQGIGIAAGSIMGIAAGISQIKEGGTSNVLGGIGSVMLSVGGLLGGLSGLGGLFKGGGGVTDVAGNLAKAPFAPKLTPGGVFANGGIAHGGFIPFRAFANGGTVNGPTLGLMGEGRYNEAIVPLPDGKSIPVNLGSSSRDLLNSTSQQSSSSPMLNMSFQSTTINGVEYVDRAQLEAAMAETRRLATRDGANRGSQLALGKLKNSPNTRRQIGLR